MQQLLTQLVFAADVASLSYFAHPFFVFCGAFYRHCSTLAALLHCHFCLKTSYYDYDREVVSLSVQNYALPNHSSFMKMK